MKMLFFQCAAPALVLAVLAGTGTCSVAQNEKASPSFRRDVLPVLTKFGCNAGGCHGKEAGQNGFRLSLRGYAPAWDHQWITQDVSGRRVDFAFPAKSLLVEKASGGVTHEGGTRFRKGSPAWQTLVDWIAARAPGPDSDEPMPVALEISSGSAVLRPGEKRELRVRALDDAGGSRDVTWLAQYFSNDEARVRVDEDGVVTARDYGAASVRVHFLDLVEVVSFTMPYPHEAPAELFAEHRSIVDKPVFDRLKALHLPPSGDCSDAQFLRRAHLDTIGVLPTPEEAAAFAADDSPTKREALVDQLLSRPEWLDYWTLQLCDLLQNRRERDHDVRGVKGVRSFHAWVRDRLVDNVGWDDLAREILTSTGDVREHPEVGYFVTLIGENREVEKSELPDGVAQSFLGTRIGCARCHNHPLERFTQDDFYSFAAFFARTQLERENPQKGGSRLVVQSRQESEQRKRIEQTRKRLAEAESSGKPAGETGKLRQELMEQEGRLAQLQAQPPQVRQPRTGEQLQARPLDRAPLEFTADRDPRDVLAEWMVASPQFSGAMVNRLWRHFFSVGLVEPVDDLRASNPPVNAGLWELLNDEFREHDFDLRHIMRLILTSRAYQLSSTTRPENEGERQFFSHYYARRLPAEVLLDAIAAATGVPDRFAGYPVGLRAVQVPDPGVSSYFLTLFGRSDRVTACACERSGDVTLPQLLNLSGGKEMEARLRSPDGRLAVLLRNDSDDSVIERLFLATLARPPSGEETAAVRASLAGADREAGFRDLFWALLNSKEFTFNH